MSNANAEFFEALKLLEKKRASPPITCWRRSAPQLLLLSSGISAARRISRLSWTPPPTSSRFPSGKPSWMRWRTR